MDIQMPGVDGLTATRRIKLAHPDARVIFVTDYDQSEFRAAAEEVGARGYVTKSDLSPLKGLIEKAVL
jgi:DNA-binding NarL/FixJ family response regulator